MSVARGCLIREAQPGLDDDAVATLMVDYLRWAIERLAHDYGVDEPPTHPSLVRDGLENYRPPVGRLILAECAGQPVGVGAIRVLRAGIVEVKTDVCRTRLARSTYRVCNPGSPARPS